MSAACLVGNLSCAQDLADIRKQGLLRHLGISCAGFVGPAGTGFDANLIQGFAKHLGVRYQLIRQEAPAILIEGLTGGVHTARADTPSLPLARHARIGDLAASGITISSERREHLLFSRPTLPTQVWVLAKADAPVKPITPGKDTMEDVRATRALMKGLIVLGKADTPLDPRKYGVVAAGGVPKLFDGSIAELVPALLIGEGDAVLLDLPVASQALRRWSKRLKVLGPMGEWQNMGVAFPRDAPDLVHAFDLYLESCRNDGTIRRLVAEYFPALVGMRPEFFETCNSSDALGLQIQVRPRAEESQE